MKIKKPKFWDYKKPNIFSFLLLPFTIPIIINNLLIRFKKKYFHQYKTNYKIKTICVGNIYIGGTGKTPLSIKISQIVKNLKYNPVFIKKSYIDSRDEEKLLAKYGTIFSDYKRTESLKKANEVSDIAIFDDGLQDGSIKYDLKFVCFNAKTFIGNGMLIPAGPLREKVNSLKNYDAIFLNGESENIENIISKVQKQKKDIMIFRSNYVLTNLDSFNRKKNYVAFAGIGMPINFYDTLIKNGFNIIKFLEYPDHYLYYQSDINKIKKIAEELDANIITTEKDYSRLEVHHISEVENIEFAKMELKIKKEDELTNFIKTSI